jgi:hypothetical protein
VVSVENVGSRCSSLESSRCGPLATGFQPLLSHPNVRSSHGSEGPPSVSSRRRRRPTRLRPEGRLAAKRHDFPSPSSELRSSHWPAGSPGPKRLHITQSSSEYAPTGHRPVTRAQETPCSEVAKWQDGGRFQTDLSEASTHQAVDREKRREICPSRVVAGEFAERDGTRFGDRSGVTGILVEGVQILGGHTNEEVTRQGRRLVRSTGIVRPRGDETGDIEAGRRTRFKST